MDDSSTDVRQTIPKRNHDASGNGGTEAAAPVASQSAAAEANNSNPTDHLMEQVVDRHNLNRAYFRVVTNKGSAGADGMPVDELLDWCRVNGQALRTSLLDGTYRPRPVKGVKIPSRTAVSDSWVSPPSLIASCNKRSCKFWIPSSIRSSRIRATGSVRVEGS